MRLTKETLKMRREDAESCTYPSWQNGHIIDFLDTIDALETELSALQNQIESMDYGLTGLNRQYKSALSELSEAKAACEAGMKFADKLEKMGRHISAVELRYVLKAATEKGE